MTPDQILKRQAIAGINKAMKLYREESYIEPPTKVIRSDSYADASRQQLDQGVVALVLATNLSGGSIGDMDLYRLVRTYLWDEKARAEINAVVKHHGL